MGSGGSGVGRGWASVVRYDDAYVEELKALGGVGEQDRHMTWGGVGGDGHHDLTKMFRRCGKMVAGELSSELASSLPTDAQVSGSCRGKADGLGIQYASSHPATARWVERAHTRQDSRDAAEVSSGIGTSWMGVVHPSLSSSGNTRTRFQIIDSTDTYLTFSEITDRLCNRARSGCS